MSECKENVLQMIDAAFMANNTDRHCTCQYNRQDGGLCCYCVIMEGLRTARACIVASVGRLDVMRSNMFAIQEEIEVKLRKLLEEE